MKARNILPLFGMVLLSSCLKEELPVPARTLGDVQVGQACVGSDYGDQVWYDLGTNSIVSVNSKMDWDLAFECGADGWQVRVNTSRSMRALEKSGTDITQPLDTNGYGPLWRIDHNCGSADSTAIRDWRTDHPVYAIDMGYSDIGLAMGVRQLRVTAVDANGYTFEVANANGTNVHTYTIAKDPQRTYVHFRISSGQVVTIAPPKGSYDLVFTQYTYQFYEPVLAYLVTGVVNGFSGSRTARIITDDFASVSLTDTLAHPFTSDEDGVGYEWKDYDFDLAVYTVFPERVYIIEDSEGQYFKLHFTDFYDENGTRGCPKFELVAL
ncbi:MAG TPA: HmuY family protein [Flavobacteriales bacterium]|nr:HmuY family protein [Flavobacteriales bacterium]